jgi:cytochrome c peroxidase
MLYLSIRVLICLPLALLTACGGNVDAPSAAALGEKIFQDKSLSASGAQACSTCHSPYNAFAQENNLAVQLGGQNLDQTGFRAPPSLRYANLTPAPGVDPAGNPIGGFDRDGRAPTFALQAQGPLLASFEMGNASAADLVSRLQQATYADEFRNAFGAHIFDNPDAALAGLTYALQQYELEAAVFHPYNSKYDLYLNGQVALSAAELRGLALFNDPNKGNCNACHSSSRGNFGEPPAFTNFKFGNLGVPRNPAIPANANSSYFDLGLCGPDRHDLANRKDLCGSFKVPTLRNVATRKVFFHNGSFNSLTEAVTFLVQRDTNPALWYPAGTDGVMQKFNDLPSALQGNVDTVDAPFNRRAGMAPALSPGEIADLVQFLGTLSDGDML